MYRFVACSLALSRAIRVCFTLFWMAIVLVSCGDGAVPREATSGTLGTTHVTPGPSTPGRELVAEFIGRFDPATRSLTIVPSSGRNDRLGLTGEATDKWSLGASGGLIVKTTGAYYTDNSGNPPTSQGTYSIATSPCSYASVMCGGVACAAATCALVTLATPGAPAPVTSFADVDLEVVGLTTGVTISGDDSSSLNALETSSGIDRYGLGVWRWPSGVTTTAKKHANDSNVPWQFNTASAGMSWEFGLRAWKLLPVLAITPVADFTIFGASVDVVNQGSSTTGALTITYSGSTAITLAPANNACTTLVPSGVCVFNPTLTCPAGLNGDVSGTYTVTDASSGNKASTVVTGVCNSTLLTIAPAKQTLTTKIGDTHKSGTAIAITNHHGAVATLSTVKITLAPSTATATAFSVADDCSGTSLAASGSCSVLPLVTCTASTTESFTATLSWTDGALGDSVSAVVQVACAGQLVTTPNPALLFAPANSYGAPPITLAPVTITNTSAVTSYGPLEATGGTGSGTTTFTGCIGAMLLPGASCTLSPSFSCGAADFGLGTRVYTVADAVTGDSVPITITGVCDMLTTTPTTLDLGIVQDLATVTTSAMTVTNHATTTTGTLATTLTGSASYASNGCASTLASGASCTVQPTFNCYTAASGTRATGTVTVTDTVTTNQSAVLTISALCNPLTVSSLSSFGFVAGNSSASATVNLTNNSTATISTLDGPTLSVPSGPISVTDNCSHQATQGASCRITPKLNCVGVAPGPYSTTVTYADDAFPASTFVTFTVSGVCYAISPSSLATTGLTGYWQIPVTPAPLTLKSVSMFDSALGLSVTGSPTFSFPDCGGLITAGGSCNVAPTLTCLSTSPASVSGIATYTDAALKTTTVTASGSCLNPLVLSATTSSIGGYQDTPQLASTAITLSNRGSVDATVSLAVTGTNASLFSFPDCGGTVAANTTCTVTPTLTCGSANSGAVSALATYTDRFGVNLTISASGTCTNPLVATGTSAVGFYGSTTVGTTNLTVKNLGPTTTTVTGAATGANAGMLSVSSCGSLATGATCNVTPSLTCGAGSPASVSIPVVFTDDQGSTVTANVTASCLNPLVATGASVGGYYGVSVVGTATLTVRNLGPTPTTVTGAATGANAGMLTLSSCGLIAGASTCTVTPTVTCVAGSPASATIPVVFTDDLGTTAATNVNVTCVNPLVAPPNVAIGPITSPGTASGPTITVVNASAATITVTQAVNPDLGPFTVGTCGTLAPHGTCSVSTSLTCATASGPVTRTITFTPSTGGVTTTVTLLGVCN